MRETRTSRSRSQQQVLAQSVKPESQRQPLGEASGNTSPEQAAAVSDAKINKPRERPTRSALGLSSSPARRRIAVVIPHRPVTKSNASQPPASRSHVLSESQAFLLGPPAPRVAPLPARKGALGSPIRQVSNDYKASVQQGSSLSSHNAGTGASPLKQPAQRLPHHSRMTSPTKPPATVVTSSPQKTALPAAASPLKKPPTRFLHNTPKKTLVKSNTERAFAEEDAEAIDELSLPLQAPITMNRQSTQSMIKPAAAISSRSSRTAPQSHITPARLMHRPAKQALRQPSASILDAEENDDDDDVDDELAIQQLTPRVPPSRRITETPPVIEQEPALYSPPTDMDLEDDWQPSLGLSHSFSELTLQQGQQRQQSSVVNEEIQAYSRSPKHISFDDAGEALPVAPIIKKGAKDMVLFIDVQPTGVLADTKAAQEFGHALEKLGCRVFTRWNWNPDTQTPAKTQASLARRIEVTHVVFFNGSARTLRKVQRARQLGIHVECCALSWAVQCRTLQRLTVGTAGHEIDVDEELDLLAKRMKVSPAKQHQQRPPQKKTPVSSPTKAVLKTPSPKRATPETPSMQIEDLIMEEYLQPVQFDDGGDEDEFASPGPCIDPALLTISADPVMKATPTPSSSPTKTGPPLPPRSAPAKNALALQQSLTELEQRGLQLARRNSSKFKPRLSSPLTKKHWRG